MEERVAGIYRKRKNIKYGQQNKVDTKNKGDVKMGTYYCVASSRQLTAYETSEVLQNKKKIGFRCINTYLSVSDISNVTGVVKNVSTNKMIKYYKSEYYSRKCYVVEYGGLFHVFIKRKMT